MNTPHRSDEGLDASRRSCVRSLLLSFVFHSSSFLEILKDALHTVPRCVEFAANSIYSLLSLTFFIDLAKRNGNKCVFFCFFYDSLLVTKCLKIQIKKTHHWWIPWVEKLIYGPIFLFLSDAYFFKCSYL